MLHFLKLLNVLQSGHFTLPPAVEEGPTGAWGPQRKDGAQGLPSLTAKPRPQSLAAWVAGRRRSQQTARSWVATPAPHPTHKEQAPPEPACIAAPSPPRSGFLFEQRCLSQGPGCSGGQGWHAVGVTPTPVCPGSSQRPLCGPCLWLYWGLAWGLQ